VRELVVLGARDVACLVAVFRVATLFCVRFDTVLVGEVDRLRVLDTVRIGVAFLDCVVRETVVFDRVFSVADFAGSARFVVVVAVKLRFVLVRAFSDAKPIPVWNTDRPRHTAKNSIILFIP